jgi:hypothetical protein
VLHNGRKCERKEEEEEEKEEEKEEEEEEVSERVAETTTTTTRTNATAAEGTCVTRRKKDFVTAAARQKTSFRGRLFGMN